MLDRSMPRP